MTPEQVQAHLDACHDHAVNLFYALVPNAHAMGHPGHPGPSGNPREVYDHRLATLDAIMFTLGKVRLCLTPPQADLRMRTVTQRRDMTARRVDFIRGHPEMGADQLLDAMYALGLYSPRTYRLDAHRSLEHLKESMATVLGPGGTR